MSQIIFPILLCLSIFVMSSIQQPTPNDPQKTTSKNLNGGALQICSKAPLTGFYRDGYCVTGPTDTGTHVVCAHLTNEFLVYTKSMGNDLSSAGLKAGDQWCLCALRWKQAYNAGIFQPIVQASTNQEAIRYATLHQYTNKP